MDKCYRIVQSCHLSFKNKKNGPLFKRWLVYQILEGRSIFIQRQRAIFPFNPLRQNITWKERAAQLVPCSCRKLTCTHRWGEQSPQCLQAWCKETLWGSRLAHHLKDNSAISGSKELTWAAGCCVCFHAGSLQPHHLVLWPHLARWSYI